MSKLTLLCCFEGFHLPLRSGDHFIIKEFATYVLETGRFSVYHVKLPEYLWHCLPHSERAQLRAATEQRHKLGFANGGTFTLWQLETLLNFQSQRYNLTTFGEAQATFLTDFVREPVQGIAVPEDSQNANVHCGYGPHRDPKHVSMRLPHCCFAYLTFAYFSDSLRTQEGGCARPSFAEGACRNFGTIKKFWSCSVTQTAIGK